MTTTFKKHVLAASIISVLGSVSSAAVAQEQASADDIEKIEVSGFRSSLIKAKDLKKDALGTQDTILAEDLLQLALCRLDPGNEVLRFLMLAKLFGYMVERAGKVWHIVRLMSLRPRQMQASMDLYRVVMFGESGLSRAEREMVATVVSQVNDCFY